MDKIILSAFQFCVALYLAVGGIIPFLKIHVALPVFMKCGSGQHKLTVCATKERYIIRNGIIPN